MMPSRAGATAPALASGISNVSAEDKNNWVNVSWMPHASLSQTSHVCLSVRSVQASLNELVHANPEEWQVRVTVHGTAGLPLVSVASSTPTAPLKSIRTLIKEDEDRKNSDAATTRCGPSVSNITHICQWDFLINVPIRWRDLPRDAFLRFEVVGKCSVLLHEATLPFFSAYGRLHTGLKRLKLKAPSYEELKNPGLLPPTKSCQASPWQEDDPVWKASRILDQLSRFEGSKNESVASIGTTRAFGHIPRVPWLDVITKERCESVLAESREQAEREVVYGHENSPPMYLIIELPIFEVPVMHEETFYPVPHQGVSGSVTPLDLSLSKKKSVNNLSMPRDNYELVPFLDYENENDNPVEDKYRTLAHDLLRGLVDPALKPDRVQRDRLAAIIASPSHHPSREEKDLLWRFRFSLVDNRRALTKFLLAVDWTVESEVVQAAELLEQWRKRSPIEVTDALKLLGKQVAYQTNLVRAYAIDTLAAAPDDELRLYLLQLVQALKFENMQETGVNQTGAPTAPVSSLATFLIGRAAKNLQLANYLYWYLKVELQDPTHGARYREVFAELQQRLAQTPFRMPDSSEPTIPLDTLEAPPNSEAGKEAKSTSFKSIVDSVSKLGSSLRGTEQVASGAEVSVRTPPRSVWDVLTSQDLFISGVMDIQMRSRDSRGKKDAKEANLKSNLSKEGYDKNPRREPVPLPSAPEIIVNGVNPQTAKIFKSALYPALVEFHVECVLPAGGPDFGRRASRKQPNLVGTGASVGGSRSTRHDLSYKVIVKTGDDLRQDQLVMMMIKLMDGLLKRASLDLCLTPYSIIATSPTSGLVEFVDGSIPVSQILANYNGSIIQFFQSCAPQQGTKYGVRTDVISAYVRSCAGYCVLTYILGVGDRHLDNILITTAGHFFHIDFGFMFGRDPKPLPPAFRLTREAFNALRKSAGLVLNLLHLMSDAGIEDLSNNPSADAEGVIDKVEERFRLELTDEQAERYFLGLINDCLAAIAPRLMDVFHSIAVARR